jgi:hypothetical protein
MSEEKRSTRRIADDPALLEDNFARAPAPGDDPTDDLFHRLAKTGWMPRQAPSGNIPAQAAEKGENVPER